MNLPEDERQYISKIYRHGLNHLVNDTIPDKLICVHSIHWCVERLLRLITQDYRGLDYRDGFETIFRKFANRHEGSLSPRLRRAVERFNEVRNGLEHRGIPPDITFLREVLTEIYEFIEWLMITKFDNTQLDVYRISAVEERQVFREFILWKDKQLPQDFYQTPQVGVTKDSIFICLIPASYSPGLINFSANQIQDSISSSQNGVTITGPNPRHFSEIEQYFREYRILGHSQVYSTPEFLRECDCGMESVLKLYPNGLIFIQFNYGVLNCQNIWGTNQGAANFIFNPRPLSRENSSNVFIHQEASQKYGTPITEIDKFSLEHLLQIVCFPFHPDCQIKMVQIPTVYFQALFVFPGMILGENNQRRYLPQNRGGNSSFSPRVYLGEEPDLSYRCSFAYDDIPRM
ncbi:MAG: hypothetical protein ACTSPV_14515, partial [Candidatus Hodarchaeales archaeon]